MQQIALLTWLQDLAHESFEAFSQSITLLRNSKVSVCVRVYVCTCELCEYARDERIMGCLCAWRRGRNEMNMKREGSWKQWMDIDGHILSEVPLLIKGSNLKFQTLQVKERSLSLLLEGLQGHPQCDSMTHMALEMVRSHHTSNHAHSQNLICLPHTRSDYFLSPCRSWTTAKWRAFV